MKGKMMKRKLNKLYLLAAVAVAVQCSVNVLAAEKDEVDPRRVIPLFKRHCAICHGLDGKGETTGGEKAGVLDYTDPKVGEKLKDIKKATLSVSTGMKDKDGKMLMAPFERKLKPAEIVALVKYLENFSKPQKDS